MDRDFRSALDSVIAEITPQPWDWTDPNGATLTVIPDGLRADPGDAEVRIRITASRTLAAEAGVNTTDLPGLIAALTESRPWQSGLFRDGLALVVDDDGLTLTVTEATYATFDPASRVDVTAAIRLPEPQRLPLASALGRALDVARGWED